VSVPTPFYDLHAFGVMAASNLVMLRQFLLHSKLAFEITSTYVTEHCGDCFCADIPGVGITIGSKEFSECLDRYEQVFLPTLTFQQAFANFKSYIFDVFRVILSHYPAFLPSDKKITVRDIRAAEDYPTLIAAISEDEVSRVGRESINGWFEYLNKLVKIDYPTKKDIQRLGEIKATRNILVHNGGRVNQQYIVQSGSFCRSTEIGSFIPMTLQYVDDSVIFITELTSTIDAKLFDKWPRPASASI
jgi:hypothetical protein